jgi:DNA-binding CsgD family transcriptional regulator
MTGGYWGFSGAHAGSDSPSVVEVISKRLTLLTGDALDVARGLAVLGRLASYSELGGIVDQTEDQLAESLGVLDDAGFLEANPSADSYGLAHPLFSSVILNGMTGSRIATWHGRVFVGLAQQKDSAATELAFHAVRSVRRPPNMLQLLEAAASEAAEAGIYSEAADWYRRVAELSSDDETTTTAMVGQAAALEHFDPANAELLYSASFARAKVPHDQVRILMGRARALRMLNRHEEALDALTLASTHAEGDGLLQLRFASAVVLGSMGQTEDAERELRSLAHETFGGPMHRMALGQLLPVAYVHGELDEAIALGVQALETAIDVGERHRLLNNLGYISFLAGEWDQTERFLGEGIESARRSGDVWFLIPNLSTAVMLAAWRGDVNRSMDIVMELRRLERTSPTVVDRLDIKVSLGMAILEKGDHEEALEVMSGLPEAVEESLERHEGAQAFATVSRGYLARGDLVTAKIFASKARAMLPFNATYMQTVDRLDAQILLAMKKPSETLSLLEPWLKNPGPNRLEWGWTSEVAAQGNYDLGSVASALEHARNAQREYESLGSAHRAERMMRWLQEHTPRLRGRPPSSRPGELTEREVEILALVAKGKTNLEIAQNLVISVGTVKKHVENIKVKLGVHRRTELVGAYRMTEP